MRVTAVGLVVVLAVALAGWGRLRPPVCPYSTAAGKCPPPGVVI